MGRRSYCCTAALRLTSSGVGWHRFWRSTCAPSRPLLDSTGSVSNFFGGGSDTVRLTVLGLP